jgi:hypothetical protein
MPEISPFNSFINSLRVSSSSTELVGLATGGGNFYSSRAFACSGVSTTISFLM